MISCNACTVPEASADLPAMKTQFIGDRTQYIARGFLRVIKIFLRQITIAKIAFKPRYAAHRQAKQRRGLRASAGNQFSAGAADIHHQSLICAAGGMSDSLINQPRLFFAADNLHRTTKDSLRFRDKFTRIDGETQCCGGNHADLWLRDILQTFSKQTQALPAAFHRFG